MSRIGQNPVEVPEGVEVRVDGQKIFAKGKLGEQNLTIHNEIEIGFGDGKIDLKPRSQSKVARNMWGTSRSLVDSLFTGVSEGFIYKLEINGVGYRAAVQGSNLQLQLGYSHEVLYPIPDGITIKCARPTHIEISGTDKQRVGQVAAEIRRYRPPEPYKGKGIKYENEYILRKEGKKK